MKEITGKSIGFIQVEVFQTEDNFNVFYLQGSNENVVPVLDFLETSLDKFSTKNA